MFAQVRTKTAIYDRVKCVFGSDRVIVTFPGRDRRGKPITKKDIIGRDDIVEIRPYQE